MHRRKLKLKQQDILNCISAENIKNKLRLNEIYSTRDTIYVTCPFCNVCPAWATAWR